jgi:hypothetical protein
VPRKLFTGINGRTFKTGNASAPSPPRSQQLIQPVTKAIQFFQLGFGFITVNGVFSKHIKRYIRQSLFVGGAKEELGSDPVLVRLHSRSSQSVGRREMQREARRDSTASGDDTHLHPSLSAQTPHVTVLQTREHVLGSRSAQVVPNLPGKIQELLRHLNADGVSPNILLPSSTASVPIETGSDPRPSNVRAAHLQRCPENVHRRRHANRIFILPRRGGITCPDLRGRPSSIHSVCVETEGA